MIEMIAAKELTMALLMVLSCAFADLNTGEFEITMMENNRKEVVISVEYKDGKYLMYDKNGKVGIAISKNDDKFVFEAAGKKEEFEAKGITPPKFEGNGREMKKVDGVEVLFLSAEGVKSIVPTQSDKWVIIKSITKPATATE